MRREEDEFKFMFDRCEKDYKEKDWSQLSIDCVEAFTRKMRMLLLERHINPTDFNAKDLMDMAIKAKLVGNEKIHQLRMIRNDVVHNGEKPDKLDEWIIIVTYKYLRPFFKKERFNKTIFKWVKQ